MFGQRDSGAEPGDGLDNRWTPGRTETTVRRSRSWPALIIVAASLLLMLGALIASSGNGEATDDAVTTPEIDIDGGVDDAFPSDRPEGGATEVLSPPRLVTAADLGEAEVEEMVDPGPATAPMPTVQEESLFTTPGTDDDPFLAQLRDAVEGDEALETEDEALSAFFDQDDDDGGRSWFGRRR